MSILTQPPAMTAINNSPGSGAATTTYYTPIVDQYFDQGLSYEDIASRTGYDINNIRHHADTTRPGYGVSSQSNIAPPTTTIPWSVKAPTNNNNATSTPAYDPFELQLLDQSIGSAQSELGRFDQYEQGGIANLLNSYNRGITQIGNDRTQARGQYDTTKTQNTQDYSNTRSGIRQDSGNLYNSVQRLLGGMGAGRSSAARVLAPFAVGQQAAQRFGGVQEQFGRNMGQLDTSWANTERGLQDAESGLEEERRNKENELRSGLNTNRASLLDRINQMQMQRGQLTGGGIASLMPQIQDNQSRVNSLLDANVGLANRYQNPSLNVRRNTFNAPNLQDYNYSRFDAPRLQGGAYDPRADYTNPLTGVLNRDEEERR